jgi:hypothetical protein
MGPTTLLSLRGKACLEFVCPKNLTALAGCEPVNLGTTGQHATSRPPMPQKSHLTHFHNNLGITGVLFPTHFSDLTSLKLEYCDKIFRGFY